jgi:DNA-binding NarL/FixJ family response regulator
VLKKKTIILADEEALFREGTAALVEASRQYNVIGQCGDGRSALRMAGDLCPDVAVLDLELPRLHALSVVRKARQMELASRFLVLGMRRDRKTVLEVLRSGAGGYVLKSDPSAVLFRGLREIVSGSIFISPQFAAGVVFRRAPMLLGQESYEHLSSREYQVFTLLLRGLRGKEIADRLDLSEKTVSTYRANLMSKLNIYDLPGLVKLAVRKKLINLH